MKKEKKSCIFVLLSIILFLLLCIIIIIHIKPIRHNNNNVTTTPKEYENDSLYFCPIQEDFITKEQPFVSLINPKQNNENISYEIYDKDNNLIYVSDKIKPGSIFKWNAYSYLEKKKNFLNITVFWYDYKNIKHETSFLEEVVIYKDYNHFQDYKIYY